MIQQICRENRYTLRFFDIHDAVNTKKEDDEELQLVQYEAEEKKIKVLYDSTHGNLGFCTSNPIEAISSYENANIQKVYWTDGYN